MDVSVQFVQPFLTNPSLNSSDYPRKLSLRTHYVATATFSHLHIIGFHAKRRWVWSNSNAVCLTIKSVHYIFLIEKHIKHKGIKGPCSERPNCCSGSWRWPALHPNHNIIKRVSLGCLDFLIGECWCTSCFIYMLLFITEQTVLMMKETPNRITIIVHKYRKISPVFLKHGPYMFWCVSCLLICVFSDLNQCGRKQWQCQILIILK